MPASSIAHPATKIRRLSHNASQTVYRRLMILEFPARLQIEELEMKNYLLAMISLLASAFSHAESVPLTLAWNASEGAATYRVTLCMPAMDKCT